ncbi:MAG TPA: DoxX family protein, partial [Micromonosporaceae bacterium]|nr:DoxX family protein [Micromonosporaceae bacterium]
MNIVAWVLQIVLGVLFLGAGGTKLTQPKEKLQPKMGWVEPVEPRNVKLLAAAEILGALGLVLPWATGIAKILTPLAAVG